MRFTDMLGLDNEATCAGYLNLHYCTVKVDGKDYKFDACPDSRTGIDTSEIMYIN